MKTTTRKLASTVLPEQNTEIPPIRPISDDKIKNIIKSLLDIACRKTPTPLTPVMNDERK